MALQRLRDRGRARKIELSTTMETRNQSALVTGRRFRAEAPGQETDRAKLETMIRDRLQRLHRSPANRALSDAASRRTRFQEVCSSAETRYDPHSALVKELIGREPHKA